MSWEGVPWMVAEGEHSAEVGRLLAYAATAQGEGVIGPEDCKVTASDIPDGNIHIQPGAVACQNRFPGGDAQAYLVRNVGDEVKGLTAQGSGGSRYDLVCVVVQDPQYPGQPAPASPEDGPYTVTKVYENVPAATVSLAEVDSEQTGYALALVKFDISDGTVNAADVTDLRDLLMPRSTTAKFILNGAALTNLPGAYGVSPPGASWAVRIPKWAARVQLEARWAGVQHVDAGSGAGSAAGGASVNLGALGSSGTGWSEDATGANKPTTSGIIAAEDMAIPEAMRGTVQSLQAKLCKTSGTGMTSRTTTSTTVVAEARFYEALI